MVGADTTFLQLIVGLLDSLFYMHIVAYVLIPFTKSYIECLKETKTAKKKA